MTTEQSTETESDIDLENVNRIGESSQRAQATEVNQSRQREESPVNETETDAAVNIDAVSRVGGEGGYRDLNAHQPMAEWVPPKLRHKRVFGYSNPVAGLAARLVIQHPEPPAPVLEAQRAALDAVDTANSLYKAMRAVDADRAEEIADHRAAATSALDSDRPAPVHSPTDWEQVRAQREAEWRRAVKVAQVATADFVAVHDAELPAWRDAVVATAAACLKAARRQHREAARSIRAHRAAVQSAEAMSVSLGLWSRGWHASVSGIRPAVALAALSEVENLVQSDDPVTSGTYLEGPVDGPKPPLHTRAWMSQRDQGSYSYGLLAAIEAREQYQITAHTQGARVPRRDLTPAEIAALSRNELP